MKIDITELSKTELLGSLIADYLKDHAGLAIFYLDGDLGSGKTTLVREALKSLGWLGPVKSPTFSIIEEYSIAEFFLELNVNKDFRSISFKTEVQKFLNCIDRININNPA